MAVRNRLNTLEDQITELHARRFVPPLLRWIREQDTETLTTLRQRLEAGQDILTAMEGLTHD